MISHPPLPVFAVAFCRVILLLVGLACAGAAFGGVSEQRLSAGEWGDYTVLLPERPSAGRWVMLFSDRGGVTRAEVDAARASHAQGDAVALIDSREFLSRVDRPLKPGETPVCLDVAGPVQWTGQMLQRRFGGGGARPLVVAGKGLGGALAYIVLAQSPPGTFVGGVSIDFPTQIPLNRELCDVAFAASNGNLRQLSADTTLGGDWRVGAEGAVTDEVRAFAERAALANHRRFVEPPSAARFARLLPELSRSVGSDPMGQGGGMVSPPGAGATPGQGLPPVTKDSLADVPVVEVSPASGRGSLVLIVSGDGGWRDIDKKLGNFLKREGFAVVGVDSLRYFWKRKTPEALGRDFDALVRYYTGAWHVDQVVLIGYSFGADILPFAYNRMSRESQNRVSLISLLAPGPSTDFEIHISGWFGSGAGKNAIPLAPEVARIPRALLQCVYGTEEASESLCTRPGMEGFEIVALGGGHHFDGDYERLASKLLEGIERRSRVAGVGNGE